jgi:hypothetical protein
LARDKQNAKKHRSEVFENESRKKKIENNISMRKAKLIVILSFILLSFACSNIKFEKTGWMDQSDVGIYPNRDKMLNDLTQNNKLKGLTYRELIAKIGPDENYKQGYDTCIFYSIVTDYGWDIDPVYTKDLVFKLNKDSIVVDYEIKEWKKEKTKN